MANIVLLNINKEKKREKEIKGEIKNGNKIIEIRTRNNYPI